MVSNDGGQGRPSLTGNDRAVVVATTPSDVLKSKELSNLNLNSISDIKAVNNHDG